MAARRRNTQRTNVDKPPEFDTCNFYVEEVSHAFDPKRVLLRRVFFIDEDRTKYVSVGLYPARDYQPLVELGHVKRNTATILVLTISTSKRWPRFCPVSASPCAATSSTHTAMVTLD